MQVLSCLFQFSSVPQSCPNSLRPHGLQHARPSCPSPTPRVYSNSCRLSQWCHPAISSCCPLLLLPSIFPSIRVFSDELALRIRWTKYWSFSFNLRPSNEHSGLISFRMDWLDLLAVPRDSQESSPTSQLKSINSSAISFLYSPALTSIHDHWKNNHITDQVFCRLCVSLDLSDISLWLDSVMHQWRPHHRSDAVSLSLLPPRWHMSLILSFTNNDHCDHLIKVVSARILYYKVTHSIL